jgi:subtilisin family serine protease
VVLRAGEAAEVAREHARAHGADLSFVYRSAIRGYAAALPAARLDEVRADPRVAFVSHDRPVSATAQGLPTGVNRINAEGKANDGGGVDVAVLDTGIDLDHPDLAANIVGGRNCAAGKTYDDGNGHGTHVAGTIAAVDNGVGVVGVAPQAKLWAVRVLNNNGSGSWSSVICGVDFVTSTRTDGSTTNDIDVANMSLGGSGSDGACSANALHQAICTSVNAGVTYVVAAGNSGDDVKNHVPAAYDQVITVSALADSNGVPCGGGSTTGHGADDTFASFSNYASSTVDRTHLIAAPGVSISSTYKGGGYRSLAGTSMASPHVAGAAALYLAGNGGASPTDVLGALKAGAEPSATNFNGECATGFSHSDPGGTHPEPVVRADSL